MSRDIMLVYPQGGGNPNSAASQQQPVIYPSNPSQVTKGAISVNAPSLNAVMSSGDPQMWNQNMAPYMSSGQSQSAAAPALIHPNPNILPALMRPGCVQPSPNTAGRMHNPALGSVLVDPSALIANFMKTTGNPGANMQATSYSATGSQGLSLGAPNPSLIPENMLMQHQLMGSQVTAAAFHNLASLVPGIMQTPTLTAGPLAVPPTYNALSTDSKLTQPLSQIEMNSNVAVAPVSGLDTNEPEWKEYKSSEGRIFWHNSKTNRSTWEKPDELRTDFERLLATVSNWREFPQNKGESYWHNTETKESEWEIPAEVQKIKQQQAELDAEDWSTITIEGKSEARSKFRGFLERKGVGHLALWDCIHKILAKDPKWAVFSSVLTIGERKHIFNEYVNIMLKKYKEDRRLQKVAARDKLAEFLQAWKNGEAPGRDSTYEELPDSPEWRVLDTRERFETFEEVVSQVAANSLQKCSGKQAEEITKWLKIIRRNLLPDDSTLDEVIAFTRRYFPHDISDVNDLSICQQWKSLMTNSLTASSRTHFENPDEMTLTAKVFLYEARVRKRFRELLQACEVKGLLNAKTEAVEFWRCELPPDACDDACEPIGVGEVIEQKRAQILAKLKTNVTNWLEKIDGTTVSTHNTPKGLTATNSGTVARDGNSLPEPLTEASAESVGHIVCLDNRALSLHLQGGSSMLELFNDYVYVLWDLYEVVRDEAKVKIRDQMLKTPEDVQAWLEGLADKYQKPGVLTPLQQYCLKRIGRSNTNTEEDDEEEEGGISNGGNSAKIEDPVVREHGEIFEGET